MKEANHRKGMKFFNQEKREITKISKCFPQRRIKKWEIEQEFYTLKMMWNETNWNEWWDRGWFEVLHITSMKAMMRWLKLTLNWEELCEFFYYQNNIFKMWVITIVFALEGCRWSLFQHFNLHRPGTSSLNRRQSLRIHPTFWFSLLFFSLSLRVLDSRHFCVLRSSRNCMIFEFILIFDLIFIIFLCHLFLVMDQKFDIGKYLEHSVYIKYILAGIYILW